MGSELEMVGMVAKSIDHADAADEEVAHYDFESLEDMINFRGRLETIVGAARLIMAAMDNRIAAELGENNAIRVGDTIVRARSAHRYALTQPDRFVEWVGPDLAEVINVASALRTTALKGLCKRREVDPEVILNTFGEYVPTGGPVSAVPVSKSPQFLQKLKPGQCLYAKGKSLEDATMGTDVS